ncbi:MAG: hypothetical protein GY759_04835 [Chloroflexi bacterium]|nr:hypothetical protein [Chloroflexota bacterium]
MLSITLSSLRRLTISLLLLLTIVLLQACNPGTPTPQKIDFSVERLLPQVSTGSSVSSLTALTTSSPQPLPKGNFVKTNTSGHALLQGQLAQNKTCKIYLFQSGGIRTEACPKSSYEGSGTATCQEENTAVYKSCIGNTQMTPSGAVEIIGSWLSLTYLPDQQLTLVVVAEGVASVNAVTEFDTYALAEPITLKAGSFLFTAPDDRLHEVAGFPPREPLPIELLPPVVEELRLEPWYEQVAEQAEKDDVPFGVGPNVSQDLAFLATGFGEAFEDKRVAEGVVSAVDWQAILNDLYPDKAAAALKFPKFGITTDKVAYDPEAALELLAEAGYPDGFEVYVLVPEEDDQLIPAGEWMTSYLYEIGLQPEYMIVPQDDVDGIIEELGAKGVPVLWLRPIPG